MFSRYTKRGLTDLRHRAATNVGLHIKTRQRAMAPDLIALFPIVGRAVSLRKLKAGTITNAEGSNDVELGQ
jgi:hypothetical protein